MISLKIALRFLKSSRFQTILIVIGIAVGVSVQVFVGCLIQSLQRDLVQGTVGNSSHVTVLPAKGYYTIGDWPPMVATIEGTNLVTAVSVSADAPGLIAKGNSSLSVLVRGFDFARADKIYAFSGALTYGRLPSGQGEVLIGKGAASDLNMNVGDDLYVVTANGSRSSCSVVGIFDLKVASLNKQWALTTLATSQGIFGLGSNITSIEAQVSDVFKADGVAADLEAKLASDKVVVTNWKAENAQLLTALSSQGSSSYMIQGFVLVSVLIGIASVLAISVVQKSRQIGILKAMGIKDRDASMIFLYQGLILGIAGAILGVLAGIGLLTSFLTFAKNADGTPVISIFIDYGFVALSGTIAIIASVFAALLPARRSSKLNPIEVIRNG